MSFGMKETDRSLSMYFGFIGMIGLVRLFLQIESVYVKSVDVAVIFSNPIILTYICFNLFVAVTYLSLAFRLRTWLITKPNLVRGIVIASMALVILGFLAQASKNFSSAQPVWVGVEMIIGIYLLMNVNRLMREQRE